ncbi:cyanoexosortase B [Planktothrix mougeotii]|uniref:Cyanoexosortase B n=1 Tax=Planktothrix mougeotii LEGE 06226 TaxID=1828728 RepID=A0ABR9UKE1_9CYAN|nr:cyanoexosortase B [Planktothrix mougeotii]MBE9146621.1 cyanoexosortase B [Planktothrix mougeotii LEGE 06226]
MHFNRKLTIAIEQSLLDWVIVVLMVLLYAPLLIHWYDGWLNKNIGIEHEYFSHGLIGLPFAAYIVWTKRHQWKQLPNTSHPLGMMLILLASLFYGSGLADLVNLSFPLMLAGLCLQFKGIPGLKLQGIALVFVLLATPSHLPFLIEPLALPLQKFIAHVAGFILTQFNLDVRVEQIYLFVNGQVVEVAPHCAGLKMLFTSLYVGLMLLYWTGLLASRNLSIFFLLSAALISVIANIIRNTLLTLFHGTSQDGLFSWLHEGWGGDLYSACMLGLLVVLINRLSVFSDQ